MDISLVIPLYNEEESLPELSEWIDRVCQNSKLEYEIIFVDDGSSDTSWKVIEKLIKTNNNIKGIKFRRNYGKRGQSILKAQVMILLRCRVELLR